MNTAIAPDATDSSTYTVRIPTALKQAFDQVAGLHERNGSQLLREFMRDYVQCNAQQALVHEAWFSQQVQATREGLKTGKQASAPEQAVHAWLESWESDTELVPPIVLAKSKPISGANRKRA